MDIEEKIEISKKLQKYHYFFRAFWDIGNPIVDDFPDLKTAAISFDSKGKQVNLLINKTFWNSLNESSRLFLICHELLHIVLEHGKRFVDYYNTPDFRTMNIAADVVINEMLCYSFGFIRYDLDEFIKDKGCWMDTVFANQPNVVARESTEYYFLKLKNTIIPPNISTLDTHNVMSPDELSDLIDTLEDHGVTTSIDPDLIDKLGQSKDFKQGDNDLAGKGVGTWGEVNKSKVKIKSKWETIIKNWSKKFFKDTYSTVQRWERVKPLYSQVISDRIKLPTDAFMLNKEKHKNKALVFFFLDTSGSCIHLKDRFFKAARSLNPEKFDLRLFCFDTRVVEVDINKNKVYGGGGTNFGIIEEKIQEIISNEKKKYPDGVFIITDGFGTKVSPAEPKKWHWFMTHSHTLTHIPETSKIYKLSNYE